MDQKARSIPDEVKEAIEVIREKKEMKELTGEELVTLAEKMGKHLADAKLKTSQIRKFLDAVISVRGHGVNDSNVNYRDETMMIKPKLAYAAARADNKWENPVQSLMDFLSPCIDRVEDKEDFIQFANLVEAIVAYHKYYEAKRTAGGRHVGK